MRLRMRPGTAKSERLPSDAAAGQMPITSGRTRSSHARPSRRYPRMYQYHRRALASRAPTSTPAAASRLQASAARKLSPATIFQAYYRLEAQGLIESRARSGYYVSDRWRQCREGTPCLAAERGSRHT